jgi:hypothetical protein
VVVEAHPVVVVALRRVFQYGERVCNPLAQHPEGNFPY